MGRPWTCWCRGSRSVCLQTAPQVPALNLRKTNALPQQPHMWYPKPQLCSAYFVRQPLRAIQSDCAKWTKLLDLRSAHQYVEAACTTTTTVKKIHVAPQVQGLPGAAVAGTTMLVLAPHSVLDPLHRSQANTLATLVRACANGFSFI